MCVYIYVYIYILEAGGRYAPPPAIVGELLEGMRVSAGSYFAASCFCELFGSAARTVGRSGGRSGFGAGLRGGLRRSVFVSFVRGHMTIPSY